MTLGPCQNGRNAGRIVGVVMVLWLMGMAPAVSAVDSRALVVGEIEIIRNNIFSPAEVDSAVGPLSFLRGTMNGLHTNTREYVLRKELLFKEREEFRQELLDETERNLRELGFLNQIHVAAVDTTEDGRVKIQVTVRDSWSLKTNLTYSRSASGDTRWNISVSEVNFLGHALTMGVGVGADENSSFHSVWFRKRRLTNVGLEVGVDYAQREDGHHRNVFIIRPFYAVGDKWSLETRASDSLGDVRYFLSNGGDAGADPQQDSSLYARIPKHQKTLEISSLMRLSPANEGRVWRLGMGLEIKDNFLHVDRQDTWLLSDDREENLDFLLEGDSPSAREDGTMVYPFLWLRTQGRTWTKSRYVLQYGPTEDIPMDWILSLKTGPTGPALGSTTGFGGATLRTEAFVSKWMNLGSGLFTLQASVEGQAGSRENSFHLASVQSAWLVSRGAERSPWLTRIIAEVAHGSQITGDRALLLGLNRGLRTLDFDGMAGDRLVRWNLEQGKVMPWEIMGMAHIGVAAFYSGGCAWWDDEDRGLQDARHEVGVGIRMGPTRSANALTSKIDLSWSLDGSRGPVFTAATRGFF